MANGTTSPQSGGILDTIGSDVKGLAGIAGQILPYALPIGLGAVMGHGLPGGALGGGAAGLAMAEGASGERQRQEQELAMKQQELGLRAQEADIEIQKAKISLSTEEDRTAYAKTIKDPDLRQMYKDDPGAYFTNMQWKSTADILSQDPTLKANNPLVAKLLPMLGPSMGPKLLESAVSGKFPNGHVTVNNADGTTTVFGLGPNGEKTPIAHGVMPKIILAAGAVSPEDKASTALDTKATSAVQKEYDQMRKANQAVAGIGTELGIRKLPYPNLPDTFDDYLTSSDGQTAFTKVRQSLSTANANLRDAGKKGPVAPIPAGKPPKELWGKSGVINGKRVNIDANGNVSSAE